MNKWWWWNAYYTYVNMVYTVYSWPARETQRLPACSGTSVSGQIPWSNTVSTYPTLIHCVPFGGISFGFSLISPRLTPGRNNIGWIHSCKSSPNYCPPSLQSEMIVDNLIEEEKRKLTLYALFFHQMSCAQHRRPLLFLDLCLGHYQMSFQGPPTHKWEWLVTSYQASYDVYNGGLAVDRAFDEQQRGDWHCI